MSNQNNYWIKPLPGINGPRLQYNGSLIDNRKQYSPYSDVMSQLQHTLSADYGGGYLGQYRSAQRGLRELPGMSSNPADSANLASGLKAMRANAALGAGLTALGGATQIYDIANNISQVRDISGHKTLLDEYGRIGANNYSSQEDIDAEWERLNNIVSITKEDLRGATKGQKWGSVGSAALAGAAAGTAINPGIGTAVGAGLGAIAAGVGVLTGDRANDRNYRYLSLYDDVSHESAQLNLNAAQENYNENLYRQRAVNIGANGGPMPKKLPSMGDFANKVLSQRSATPNGRRNTIVRQKCDGGMLIRIKR